MSAAPVGDPLDLQKIATCISCILIDRVQAESNGGSHGQKNVEKKSFFAFNSPNMRPGHSYLLRRILVGQTFHMPSG
jgi:hypothetical protein